MSIQLQNKEEDYGWLIINGYQFNISQIEKQHPGGKDILRVFQQKDVTDFFFTNHSDVAIKKMNSIQSDKLETYEINERTKQFRQFFNEIPNNIKSVNTNYQFAAIAILAVILLFSVYASYSEWSQVTILLMVIFVILNENIMHDLDHLKNERIRNLSSIFINYLGGVQSDFWTLKHSIHHLSNDAQYRASNYFPIYYAKFLKKCMSNHWCKLFARYFKFHLNSFIFAIHNKKNRLPMELAPLIIHLIWKLAIFRFSILNMLFSECIASYINRVIIQQNHILQDKWGDQNGKQEKNPNKSHDYVLHQVNATRNYSLKYGWLQTLFMGMNYHIQHHIFPMVPWYRLHLLQPLLKEFCQQQKIPYEERPLITLLKIDLIKQRTNLYHLLTSILLPVLYYM